jgi:uncharacterized protein
MGAVLSAYHWPKTNVDCDRQVPRFVEAIFLKIAVF